jgi:cell division protein FtsZ
VQGISDIITIPGIINRDFADVKTIMAGMGYAVMGTATARGENRATAAAQAAIASPLLEAGAIDGARGILINVTGSSSLRLAEVNEASTIIQSAAHEDANIIFGAVLDEKMKDEVKITVIATGFKEAARSRELGSAASSALHARSATSATHQPPPMREAESARSASSSAGQGASYIPESTDDLELGSEVVRHAEPVDEARTAATNYSREAESAYASLVKGAGGPTEEPAPIDTVTSSVNITYDAQDLEIPAFLRKRGEN